ncbi:hypothetical protein PCASD_26656, partial [Puccinia coronata f. sp. avenae]
DLAKQIIPFIIGSDLKEEVEEMSGYEDRNWELLKKQLLNRFGSSLELVKYTQEDLKNLIKTYWDKGGISTLEEFKMFRSKFENITHYLKRLGYVTNLEDFRENMLEALSSELEITVTRELIRENKMLVSKDGGDILPDTSTLFNYIHREVQTASVMERRNKFKAAPSNKTQPVQRTTQNPTQSAPVKDQAVEQLTKSLASWNAQKQPTTFYQSSHVPYQPAQNFKPPEHQFCQYCYLRGHPTGRCNLANFDEIQGLVKKEGRDFKLPDGSTIPWDRNRPYKAAVDQFHSKTSQQGIIQLPPGTQIQQPEERVPDWSKIQNEEFLLGSERKEKRALRFDCKQSLPEKLARIVASKFILDAAIRFKLRQGATELIVDRVKLCGLGVLPPDLDWSLIHSVARRPILNWMAASDVNSGVTIQASIAGSES